MENNLRVSTGKTAATSLDHLEELEEAEEPTDAGEHSTNETQQSMLTFEKIKDDPMLEEAGRVLRDLIKLNSASERGREIASVGRAPELTLVGDKLGRIQLTNLIGILVDDHLICPKSLTVSSILMDPKSSPP